MSVVLILSHSAKGSTWKDHKYIKRLNGTYYYPKSYEGGRHLDSDDENESSGSSEDLEDWEKTLYEDIEETLSKNPGLFDPKDIIDEENFQAFTLTLEEAGIDTDGLSKDDIERMKQKVSEHYAKESESASLTDEDVEDLANEVIRGNFGNGSVRKDLLGENYQKVQDKVNEIYKKNASKKVSHSDDSGYLAHHGIKGQKWGVRRFQNADGTLTDAGRRRLGQGKENKIKFDESGRVRDEDRGKARSRIHQEVANDYRSAGSALSSGRNIASTAQQAAGRSARMARQKAQDQMDVSKMSDQELRDAVNRLNLERTYKSLSTESIGSGRQYAGDILATAGDVLAVGASIASILVALHEIKK